MFTWTNFLALIVILSVISCTQPNLIPSNESSENTETITSGIDDDIDYLRSVYDLLLQDSASHISRKDLLNGAINGMIDALGDTHARFIPDNYDSVFEQVVLGQIEGGIGVQYNREFLIINVFEDMPAHRAGIRIGDVITHVNDIDVHSVGFENIGNEVGGDVDTTVKIVVNRDGEQKTFYPVRGIIKIPAIFSKLYGNELYIKIDQFLSSTERELIKAWADGELELGTRVSGIVLDLRNNPGGILEQAVFVVDLLIDRGIIVTTESTNGTITSKWEATREYTIDSAIPIVVLINGGSASASEIVSGSLKDHNRAIIMGTLSYGKGSVQDLIPIGRGNGLKFTIAKYFTALHNPIDGVGITPDIVIPLPEDYTKHNWKDLDPQIEAALDMLRTGLNKSCKYTVIEDQSEDGYGISKTC